MDAALLILDGWGCRDPADGGTPDGTAPADVASGDGGGRNAVAAADTPAFDRFRVAGATGRLRTCGRAVGLPAGQAGNSEVGHLTVGAGRVVRQAYTRIEDAVAAGDLLSRPALAGAADHVADTGGRLHLLGLASDGGVHADHTHLHALVEAAAERGLDVVTHPFTDGRDTSPTAGEDFLAELEAVADAAGTGHPATVVGRYYAMDRDEHWERTHAAYRAIVEREAPHRAPTGPAAVRAGYDRGETDEFLEPTLVDDRPAPADGDAVVCCNFRADRARQLTRMLADYDPTWTGAVGPVDPPDVHIVTMTEYDESFPFPVAFPPSYPEATLGAALADAGLAQLRVAESEKYAHVTYFLNGGREPAVAGEDRVIVPSPDVPTYDQQPEMSAATVTDRILAAVAESDPDVLVANYANPDMVGHTGDFEAAVAAVEAVDAAVARLVPALRDAGATVLLTADHGNAEEMGTAADPHTRNPVPFVALAPDGPTDEPGGADGGLGVAGTEPTAADPAAGADRPDGADPADALPGLRNVAPTLLALAGVDVPAAMTGASLLEPRDAG
ncbi:MAG: 2,3-bisphosphoglycerate-independent phosphoglycerate mutase [Halobacteriaceae archaeon]